jgi:hypothetical protein
MSRDKAVSVGSTPPRAVRYCRRTRHEAQSAGGWPAADPGGMMPFHDPPPR